MAGLACDSNIKVKFDMLVREVIICWYLEHLMESQNGTNIAEPQKIRFLGTARKISLLNLISRFQLEVIGTYLGIVAKFRI